MRFRPGHAWPARAALIAAVPATAFAAAALPGVHLFADADTSTAVLDTLVVAALLAVAAAIGPRALDGASRGWALVTVLAAIGTFLVGGIVWLIVAVVSLCSDSAGPGLAALATGAAVYVPGSVYAFRDARRTAWAWPLVIALALAASLLVLALIAGGPHACET
jgi:hypothetical protein